MNPNDLHTVLEGRSLTRTQAQAAMRAIMCGEATHSQIAGFLAAEKLKRETYQEIAGFALAMRERATVVKTRRKNPVDMCGTGGDGAGTFNISTVASFVVAAAGVAVAKHGNRSVSGKCGSADLLEALGVRIELDAVQAGHCLDEIGFGFLYAPLLHTAMKHASVPRRELGVATVFNLLGPITNPAGVRRQVVGAFDRPAADLLARALAELGAEHALVLHSDDGLDEISVFAPTTLYEVSAGGVVGRSITPEELGLKTRRPRAIPGGDVAANREIALAVLMGERGVARNLVVANAAAGLLVGAAVPDLRQGAELAASVLDDGRALAKLADLQRISEAVR